MTDEWFHKRGPHEGTGYSIKSRSGLIAAVIFITLGVGVVIGAAQVSAVFGTSPLPTLLVGLGIEIVLIMGFVVLVICKSDARR